MICASQKVSYREFKIHVMLADQKIIIRIGILPVKLPRVILEDGQKQSNSD